MCFYFLLYIVHTTIAYFHCVSIDYLVQLVVFWEVFVEERYELSSDVAFDVFAVWWVEPGDIPLPVVSFFCVVAVF